METIKCKHCGGFFKTLLEAKSVTYVVTCPHCCQNMLVKVAKPKDYITFRCPKCNSEKRVLIPLKSGVYGLNCQQCGNKIIVKKK